MDQTCLKAVQHLSKTLKVIQMSLDGKNQEVVLLELGVSIYRALYDHIMTFTVNSNGELQYTVEPTNELGLRYYS